MIVRVASTLSRVSSRGGWSSSTCSQPSSKATRFSRSKRPVSLLAAPRPLRALTVAGISMSRSCRADENIARTDLRCRQSSRRSMKPLDCRLPWPRCDRGSRRSSSSDGGSTDDTASIAAAAGALVVDALARPRQPARGRRRRRVRRLAAVSARRLPPRSRAGRRRFAPLSPRRTRPVGPVILPSRWMTRAARRGGLSASCGGAARCWRCLTATRDC